MKTDSKGNIVNPKNYVAEMSKGEIEAVSGGGFKLAAPGGNYWTQSPRGPLKGGYVL